MGKDVRIPEHLKPWIEAHRRFRLSHMHIQMAVSYTHLTLPTIYSV